MAVKVCWPPNPTQSILLNAGQSVSKIMRVTSEGDMGDGQGEECLWLTSDKTPRPMVGRIKNGRLTNVTHGW